MPLGGECASSTASLLVNCMPPRITTKSYRPRASDRTMVDTIQPRSLSSFRTQKRRHDYRMNRLGTENPRAYQHYVGWKARQIFLLLPVVGDLFPLTFPFYRTA